MLAYINRLNKTKKLNQLKKQIKIESPAEIKKAIGNMERCSRCHFIVFDNYFKNEDEPNIVICPTCGLELLSSLNDRGYSLPSTYT